MSVTSACLLNEHGGGAICTLYYTFVHFLHICAFYYIYVHCTTLYFFVLYGTGTVCFFNRAVSYAFF